MRIITLLLIISVLVFPVYAQAAEMYTLETVKRIISADTFELDSGKKIRLIGADAPEVEDNRKAREDCKKWGLDMKTYLQMGEKATEWIESRIAGKRIFLKYDKKKTDERGYEWVYIFLYDQSLFYGGVEVRERYEDVQFEWWQLPERALYIFINGTMIRGGYATHIKNPPNTKYADDFEKYYQEAKEKAEGLWNVNYHEVPCVKEGAQIGNCAGCIVRCCGDSEPVFDLVINGKCTENPVSGASGYCSNCGNNICESKYMEDKCNCPLDCN